MHLHLEKSHPLRGSPRLRCRPRCKPRMLPCPTSCSRPRSGQISSPTRSASSEVGVVPLGPLLHEMGETDLLVGCHFRWADVQREIESLCCLAQRITV